MQLAVGDFGVFSVVRGQVSMLLKIGKDLSFRTKVDFIMNSLILSAELLWSVFSWSIPSKAILNQELSMSMAVHRATLHRRHCTQVLHFQAVTYPCFCKMLKNCHSLFSPCFLRGRRGKAVRKNTCHLRASSCSRSFLKPSNKKNGLILCSKHLYPRPTKYINTFFAFEDLHSKWNFCFESYLLDLMYFCLWGGNSLWWQGLNDSG